MKFITNDKSLIPTHFEYKGDVILQDLDPEEIKLINKNDKYFIDIFDIVYLLTTRGEKVVLEKYRS